MLLAAAAVVIAVVVGYARGGRLGRMADAELRHSWLLFVGLGLQIALDVLAARDILPGTQGYPLLLVSQLAVLGWVAVNWWRPGMILIGLGLLLNAAVIAANGAMPVDTSAVQALGGETIADAGGKHIPMTDETVLPWLGDIFPITPIRTIISVGDIVLAAGLVPLVTHLMTYRTRAERRGGLRETVDSGAHQ